MIPLHFPALVFMSNQKLDQDLANASGESSTKKGKMVAIARLQYKWKKHWIHASFKKGFLTGPMKSVMEKHPPPSTPPASMLEEVEVGNSLASAAVTVA
ncbi:hypothetical protein Q7C36_017236 [Tachysurus vachellii]|uniref:Uncharacterized protein n=1 Tax=Tachysurus vachellii TaxID=175792 RepID=A0AA88M301_TACVA|nr:hypothetical protein Q7C36_017236 [Tachysurus vachellii]